MHIRTALLVITILAQLGTSQEGYWVAASAASGGNKKINPGGALVKTALPATARDILIAPDGKLWYYAATVVTVLQPDGSLFKTITASGSVYSLAADKQGHVWLAYTTIGVEEFDANGVSLGIVPLAATAPRGICVDSVGNKWVAHYLLGALGSISRIDAVTRAVTNHPMPTGCAIRPLNIFADARGFGVPSHLWVVGDGPGELDEFDAMGNALNRYVIDPAGKFQMVTGDVDSTGKTRFIWIGDWTNPGTGKLHKVDVSNGTFTTTTLGAGIMAVNFDGFGNLWATHHGTGMLRRIDPATKNIEVETSVGALWQLSTRWQFVIATDQLGDADGDGAANLTEVMAGSSPLDPYSTPTASISIEGSTKIGTTTGIGVLAGAGVPTGLAFAAGLVPQPGFQLPGIGGSLLLDPASLLPFVLTITGPQVVPMAIPNSPALVGGKAYLQGVNLVTQAFTNTAAILFY